MRVSRRTRAGSRGAASRESTRGSAAIACAHPRATRHARAGGRRAWISWDSSRRTRDRACPRPPWGAARGQRGVEAALQGAARHGRRDANAPEAARAARAARGVEAADAALTPGRGDDRAGAHGERGRAQEDHAARAAAARRARLRVTARHAVRADVRVAADAAVREQPPVHGDGGLPPDAQRAAAAPPPPEVPPKPGGLR